MPGVAELALGLIAGGQGSRLGGVDKALLRVEGRSQVLRLLDAFGARVAERWIARGAWMPPMGLPADVVCLPDRVEAGLGPIAGLDALAQACTRPWLLTLPIDLHAWPETLMPELSAACTGDRGAVLEDSGGLQPLVAIWPVPALRAALPQALAQGRFSVRDLSAALGLRVLHRPDWTLQNLNTPEDLARSGASPGPGGCDA
jgi:molybdenum cofactor guanylyltransferase